MDWSIVGATLAHNRKICLQSKYCFLLVLKMILASFFLVGLKKMNQSSQPMDTAKEAVNEAAAAAAEPSAEPYTEPSKGFPEVPKDSPAIVLRSVINEGGLSVVHSGLYGEKKVAVKCPKADDPKGRCIKQMKVEMDILRLLNEKPHPNVIEPIACVGERLVLPLFACDLFEYMSKTGVLTEQRGKAFFRQMAEALLHCHRLGVAHGDVKLENFAIDKYPHGRTIPVIILIDFGGAATSARTTADMCMSPQYAAPEVRALWRTGTKLSIENQCSADVWALGVVLFCLLHKFVPYSMKRPLTKLQSGDFGSEERWNVSKSASHLLRQMMAGEPSRRIGMKDILRHGWLRSRAHTWVEWGSEQLSSYLFAM